MDFGLAVIVSAIVGSFTFLIKDLIKEGVEGLWLRFSDEINIGDKVKIMRRGKILYEGIVVNFGLRNTLIEEENNNKTRSLNFIENSKIFEWEVKKLDGKEEKIY